MRSFTRVTALVFGCCLLTSGALRAQSQASFSSGSALLGTPVTPAIAAASSSEVPADHSAAPAENVESGAALADESAELDLRRDARIFGLSGRLRAVTAPMEAEIPAAVTAATGAQRGVHWVPLMGTRHSGLLGVPVAQESTVTPAIAGIWSPAAAATGVEGATEPAEARETEIALITQVPFSSKRGSMLNGYHIGRYPTEGTNRTDRYAPPAGFIEVTPENQDFFISENFQLRQFLTKDQRDVWPKYLALDLRLIDKLELVLIELNEMGIRADRMHVMSGYRTPQYNGPGTGGRAQLSRHTYGDGADVWVDNDGNGYMDDLNGDGVVDLADAQVMLRAVERVERKYPELIGGAGLYVANSAHGPFIHIDVRGQAARW